MRFCRDVLQTSSLVVLLLGFTALSGPATAQVATGVLGTPGATTFDVGMDTRSGVAMLEYRYDPPFKFTGKINRLTFKLEPELKDPAQAKAELGPTPAPEPDPIEQPAAKQPAAKARK